jgi:hypothetical protein
MINQGAPRARRERVWRDVWRDKEPGEIGTPGLILAEPIKNAFFYALS